MDKDQQLLDELRHTATLAEQRLRLEVIELCPGMHLAQQHRDRQEPWCHVCGRSDRGVRIKEV